MNPIDLRMLVAEAMLAPSVHNVQPARWRIEGAETLLLLEDLNCRLAAGDPSDHDAATSLGAAAEGLRLAASRHGLAVTECRAPLAPAENGLAPVARYRLETGLEGVDPLAKRVEARCSWRAAFASATPDDRRAAAALAGEEAAIVTEPSSLARLGRLADRASFGFMRDRSFRRELLAWMRLSPRHPRWAKDGLNAEAMAMSRIEAIGAGLVLGPTFALLDRLRLARPLLAEGGKLAEAAALVVFHRPAGEPPFASGAHFYRLWLRIEAAGFGAAVLAALADDRAAAAELGELAQVPTGRRIVSAFRIGRRPPGTAAPRARRPVNEILV